VGVPWSSHPLFSIPVDVTVNKAKLWWIKLVRMHVQLSLYQSGRWWHWKKGPCTFRNNFATKSFFCEQLQKLKERNKLLATMTGEHNQLLVQLGEIETHLSIAQTTKLVGCLELHSQYKKVVTNISPSQIRCFYTREVGWRQLEKWNGVEFVSTNIHTYRCLQSPWPKVRLLTYHLKMQQR
jgi:hypothetical protein